MSIAKVTVNGLEFQNVVAAGTATAKIEIGMAIERIQLVMGGTAFNETHMENIKIRANGTPILDISGSDLKKLMAYRGVPQSAGFLDIDFTELTGRDLLDQIIGSFDTRKGVGQLSMEVKIVGATAPTLAYRITKSATQRPDIADKLQKILRYPWQVSTGGQLAVSLPFGQVNGSVIKRIHITHSVADNVVDVTVKQNSAVIWEGTAAANVADQTAHGRVPQTKIFTVDFTLDRNQRNSFDTRDASSILLLPRFGAADSGDVLVEYYDKLNNL